eukprot:5416188-Ditylum_brightwellii.AAC.1
MKSIQTTANSVALSSAIYNALIHIVGGNHLLPFINNKTFRDKGLEMLDQLFMEHGGLTGNTATKMQSEFNLSKIGPAKSLNNFVFHLRTYSTKLNTILCNNFCKIKHAHDKNTLNWRPQGLAKALVSAKGIKCNLSSSSNW